MDESKAAVPTAELGRRFGDEGMGIDFQARQIRDELQRAGFKPLYSHKRLILWDPVIVTPHLVSWRAARDRRIAAQQEVKPEPILPDIDFEVEFKKLEDQNRCLLRAIAILQERLDVVADRVFTLHKALEG